MYRLWVLRLIKYRYRYEYVLCDILEQIIDEEICKRIHLAVVFFQIIVTDYVSVAEPEEP